MKKESQSWRVYKILKSRPNQKLTARELAEVLIEEYAHEYSIKRQNPRFKDDKDFLSQIVAEIGAQKDQIAGHSSNISWQDKPRPRKYCYSSNQSNSEQEALDSESEDYSGAGSSTFTEHDLYPMLIEYLSTEHHLYSMRIDEKRSKNARGAGGNHWLHPDVVSMEPVAKRWHQHVKTCISHGGGSSVRLWSFEVKKTLTMSNLRKCFFQAVSNSSWANEGYLVATSISDSNVLDELRMLSSLHGIGVILINPENVSESEVVFPAQRRPDIDWQSVNRIVNENSDFRDYIDLVSNYYQTGRLREREWNK